MTTNLKRYMQYARSETEIEYFHLNENAKGLVQFCRDGFGVDDEGYINDILID